jgi:hypothetical protein
MTDWRRIYILTSLLLLEDEEEEDIIASLFVRQPSLWRKQWECDYLRNLADAERSFLGEYRMDPASFDILLQLLYPRLDVEMRMARVSMAHSGSDDITSDSRLGAALIMLGGGRQMEAMRTHGISKAQAFANLHRVVAAVNDCPALDITFNTSREALDDLAAGFKKRSKPYGIFKKCVGAIDGLAIKIKCPRRNEVINQSHYYSGSKKIYCMNMQAVCDSDCKFTLVSCRHVGSTNDGVSFRTSSLKGANESLPFPMHFVGDAAYVGTEQMIVPYEGINLHITCPPKDWFNFWQSQVRITIERCFGIFIATWGIFWVALSFSPRHSVAIVNACCRLHNFLRKRRIPVSHSKRNPPATAALNEDGQLVDDDWRDVHPNEDFTADTRTGSTLRENLLQHITTNSYSHSRNI